VPPAAVTKLDELIVSHPLATLRWLATESGLSRDTAQKRKEALVQAGLLSDLSYEEVRIARNRDRFAQLGLEPAQRRNRLRDVSFRITVRSASSDEVLWSSGEVTFRALTPVDAKTAEELKEKFETNIRYALLKDWPKVRAALEVALNSPSGSESPSGPKRRRARQPPMSK